MLTWKDYKYGSWLVIEFGLIDAKVVELGEHHFGIIIHPFRSAQLLPGSMPDGGNPTLEDAKFRAEQMLKETILPAAKLLKEMVPA